jgi:hypothetical protein
MMRVAVIVGLMALNGVRAALPWPLPNSLTNGTTTLTVSPQLTFTDASKTATDTLAKAFQRYQVRYPLLM